MTDDYASLHADAIVIANASLFRHGAKISYLQMVHLIVGFAHGTSIKVCSAHAKAHRDTVRESYEVFRERLAAPRFKPWLQSGYAAPDLSAEEDAVIMEEAKAALFGCHENTDCLKRFTAGRRKSRLCRACPIKASVERYEGEEEQAEALVQMVDDIREFYHLLGWKESAAIDTDRQRIFEKRFRHYEVISTAITNSIFDEEGAIISDEEDFLSVHHLAKALSQELKENPIRTAT